EEISLALDLRLREVTARELQLLFHLRQLVVLGDGLPQALAIPLVLVWIVDLLGDTLGVEVLLGDVAYGGAVVGTSLRASLELFLGFDHRVCEGAFYLVALRVEG